MDSARILKVVLDSYPKQSWHGKLYLGGVLEKLRFPEMEEGVAQLLAAEEADSLRCELGVTLALYGTKTSMALAERVLDEEPRDPERFEIAEVLYAYQTAAGWENPRLSGWRRRMENTRREAELAMLRMDAWEQHAQPKVKVGRNDPCPCGSGKKFKKCCLLKRN